MFSVIVLKGFISRLKITFFFSFNHLKYQSIYLVYCIHIKKINKKHIKTFYKQMIRININYWILIWFLVLSKIGILINRDGMPDIINCIYIQFSSFLICNYPELVLYLWGENQKIVTKHKNEFWLLTTFFFLLLSYLGYFIGILFKCHL